MSKASASTLEASKSAEEEAVGEANGIFLSAAALGEISAPAITTMKLKVQLWANR